MGFCFLICKTGIIQSNQNSNHQIISCGKSFLIIKGVIIKQVNVTDCVGRKGVKVRTPWWIRGKESACWCRRRRFDPWVGKILWRREWQPAPVFLPGKFHGQQCLEGYSPRGRKSVGHDLGIKQQLKTILVLGRTYSVQSPILGLPRKSVVELWAIVFAHNSIPRVPGMKLAHFPKVCRMPVAYKLRPGSSMFLFWNEGCVFQDSQSWNAQVLTTSLTAVKALRVSCLSCALNPFPIIVHLSSLI